MIKGLRQIYTNGFVLSGGSTQVSDALIWAVKNRDSGIVGNAQQDSHSLETRAVIETQNGVIELEAGQCVAIIGPAAAGKTTLINQYLRTTNDTPLALVRFGEPEAAAHSLITLWEQLAQWMFGSDEGKLFTVGREGKLERISTPESLQDVGDAATRPVLVVDSLRKVVYTASGSMGSGGVSNDIFMLLTLLSAIARQSGTTIIVVINPLVTSPQALQEFTERALGSVDTVILVSRPGARVELKSSSRLRPSRDWQSHILPLPSDTAPEPVTVAIDDLALDQSYEPLTSAWVTLAARRN